MKLQKKFFPYLLLLLNLQICFGQEKPKAVLVDEFGETYCDELSARIDAFYREIISAQNSKGYIIVYGDKNKPLEKYLNELSTKEIIIFSKYDMSRIVFLHGIDNETIKTQFWLVPAGADKPIFTEGNWNYTLPQTTKSFIFYKSSWVGEDCPSNFNIIYSKFLLANPDLHAHLVVYEKSAKDFRRTKKDLFSELVNQNKVSPNQIKFFYLKRKNPDVEFWLIPKRRK